MTYISCVGCKNTHYTYYIKSWFLKHIKTSQTLCTVNFVIIFFLHVKMWAGHYQKQTKEGFKKCS